MRKIFLLIAMILSSAVFATDMQSNPTSNNHSIYANAISESEFTVTITNPTGAVITAKAGDTTVESGSTVEPGTVLELSHELTDTNHAFQNYTVNGTKLEAGTNTVTVNENIEISADVIYGNEVIFNVENIDKAMVLFYEDDIYATLPTGSIIVDPGTQYLLKVKPNNGFSAYVAINGEDRSDEATTPSGLSFTISGKTTVDIIISGTPYPFKYSYESEEGTVTATIDGEQLEAEIQHEVPNGEIIEFTVTPNEGKTLESITLNGNDVTGMITLQDNKFQYIMNGNSEINITFKEDITTITYNVENIENAMVLFYEDDYISTLPSGTVTVEPGTQYILKVKPNTGFSAYVALNGEDKTSEATSPEGLSFTAAGQMTVDIVISGNPYTFTYSFESEEGTVTATKDGEQLEADTQHDVIYGDMIEFTVTPDEGKELESIMLNGNDITGMTGLQDNKFMYMVNADSQFNITFKDKTATITYVNETPDFGTLAITRSSDGSEIENNSTLPLGELIDIVATANEGYAIDSVVIIINGTRTPHRPVGGNMGTFEEYDFEVSGDITVTAAFKAEKSAEDIAGNAFRIYGSDNGITVCGISEGTEITVYDIAGKTVCSTRATDDTTEINGLRENMIYIVKVTDGTKTKAVKATTARVR